MEKTSVKQKRFICRGLLIFLFSSICVHAKTPSASEIRSLKVNPDSTACFTAQENGFTLLIPGVEPAKISTDLPPLPQGVVLVTSKKEEFLSEDNERGTAVHLWFNFKDTGPVRLPPLIVKIEKRTFYIPFDDVTVFENPDLISPLVQIDFISGARQKRPDGDFKVFEAFEGEEIIFDVNLKYFTQIVSFDWKLPKNSIFKELNRSEYADGKTAGRNFSDKALNVARFSWRALVPGEYAMPEITFSAIAYNGSSRNLKAPQIVLKVLPSAQGREIKKTGHNTTAFASAFSETKKNLDSGMERKISEEDCRKLAQLRSAERKSIFPAKTRAERVAFEKSLGLTVSEDEANLPFARLVFVLTGLSIALAAVFLFLHKGKPAVLFLAFVLGGCVLSIAEISKIRIDYGIFAGGVISPVPEEKTSSVHALEGAFRVKISERTGDWLYVESDDINGWTKKTSVFEID